MLTAPVQKSWTRVENESVSNSMSSAKDATRDHRGLDPDPDRPPLRPGPRDQPEIVEPGLFGPVRDFVSHTLHHHAPACSRVGIPVVDFEADVLLLGGSGELVALEASGVADPASIYTTFVDPSYRDRIRLDSVTCVVDADQVLNDEDPDLVKLKLQQIGFADLVILNKVDLPGVEGSATVKRWIDGNFARLAVGRRRSRTGAWVRSCGQPIGSAPPETGGCGRRVVVVIVGWRHRAEGVRPRRE